MSYESTGVLGEVPANEVNSHLGNPGSVLEPGMVRVDEEALQAILRPDLHGRLLAVLRDQLALVNGVGHDPTDLG